MLRRLRGHLLSRWALPLRAPRTVGGPSRTVPARSSGGGEGAVVRGVLTLPATPTPSRSRLPPIPPGAAPQRNGALLGRSRGWRFRSFRDLRTRRKQGLATRGAAPRFSGLGLPHRRHGGHSALTAGVLAGEPPRPSLQFTPPLQLLLVRPVPHPIPTPPVIRASSPSAPVLLAAPRVRR